MNENARKWVEALRSGEYEQGRGRLRLGDQYCCLGVACEIYRREASGTAEWTLAGYTLPAFSVDGEVATVELPGPVLRWLGVRESTGAHRVHGGYAYLTGLNDRGDTFAQIADLIESEPEGLFA